MNKFGILLCSLYLLCCPNYATATLVKYNITGGVDTAGYSFSGFVFIESDPIVTEMEPNDISYLRYEIGPFLFKSEGGISQGNSGSLRWMYNILNGWIGPGNGGAQFHIDTIVNFVKRENRYIWSNGMTGVFFTGVEASLEAYSLLPEQIVINSYMFWDEEKYWGPSCAAKIELSRAPPVPEPSTILLFGTSIAGLAFVGRRKQN